MPSRKTVAPKQPWVKMEIPLIKLHLDVENYRHEPVATEAEAIRQLYAVEKVEALARDIATWGSTSPLENVGVFPMLGNPGHFVTVEGNRRVTALLLLNDPDRAPSPADRKAFRDLAKLFSPPSTIEVVKFDDKASAKHWVDLRHLGLQEGQGLKSWNIQQKNRAAGDKGSDPLALAVLDRARAASWLPAGAVPAMSTLTRYLKNPEVRAALGLGHHKDLIFTHAQGEVDAALRQFVLDALPRPDGSTSPVHSRTKAEDFRAYARQLHDRGVAPSTTLPKPTPPTAPAAGKPPAKRGKRDPFKRMHLLPDDFVVKTDDLNLRRLVAEMRVTDVDHHEFANAYLLRAFVEKSMALYVRKLAPGYNWTEQQQLVQKCAELLDPTGKLSKFKAIRVAASKTDCSYSLHTLGAVVHSNLLMDRRALMTCWQNWEVALIAMLEAL